jgi:UDP-N-acetylglucosamine--N-acetylmuramyl-(pentapeptide) pyrophosphoryl-undecaprenol N-acetylglucosamine transferase
MGQRIVIMAGGTGGHVFPALAVATYLAKRDWQVSWIGTKKGMESKVVPAQGIEMDWVAVAGIRGKGLGAKVNNLLLLSKSFWQVFKIFRFRKPDVVLGFGGYVAGPGGLVASLMNIPLVIHEQNRVPGTTNKLLQKKANKVLEAFPDSFAKEVGAIFTGNPLRTPFLDLPKKQVWTAKSNINFRILVVGGSQGAKILNDTIPLIADKLDNTEIKHQTGTASFNEVTQQYAELSVPAQAIEFIDDMAEIFQWADMIICRAGAMTVSEVAAAGLPAIFIPLPQAIDDHQTANANYLSHAGASISIVQRDLNESTLLNAIEKIKGSLKEMSIATKNKAKIDATEVVADVCIKEASK